MNIIQLEQVSYSFYDIVPALCDVSLSVEEGDMIAIIGANGSGKSTLLQIMNGLIHPQSGTVRFRGEEVTEKGLRDRSYQRFFRERVGMVFQNSDVQLFCPTVFDELVFGPQQLGLPKDEVLRRASETMEMLNIEYLKNRPTHMLSGGEKKRVAIGSSLAMNPEVLLLDEPASGLDPKTESFLTDLIISLSESGKTIVIATHDLELVDHLQPKVAVISEEHRIEKTGTVDEILKDQDLLVRVNLVHEHRHRHGNRVHSHLHSHYFFHDHQLTHSHDGHTHSHDGHIHSHDKPHSHDKGRTR
ncbi:MAG TPA: ATP-binding cassette domain-containing protein [Spirochaetota bacterium]|nr:ATP-binding cassette domain-containing protein [Spirochaetota bacterium]HPC42543.1 ATP-binding cassette domain-containing protein [Spirochaetota bacterium]HPL15497.1 ATP-binding cassette domain-containing protein [Spirochaetota bacterium]HQF10169.1 ATP-binding cassette domain-containing protein [Spirochaetota bacterium]HQH98953.1 ATP-binding cassette domain-containing protein [Spirochaetota bacterium]